MSTTLQALDEFIRDYEAEHGEINDEEAAAASKRAGERVVVRGSARDSRASRREP